MLIEAIYDHGKLEFTAPVLLKHKRIKVIVDVPDIEIDNSPMPYDLSQEIVELASKLEQEMSSVRNALLPPEEELPVISEKQRQRMAAFALREDR